MTIVTLTPNPSLDRTLAIDALTRGAVLRAASSRVEAGGKGVNVARVLAANGHDAVAVLPVGGAEGDQLAGLLEAAVAVRRVAVAPAIRSNLSLVEPDGTTTKVNAPGPRLGDQDRIRLQEATSQAAVGADWVALCGSLPPDMPDTWYAGLTVRGREAGAQVAVDTSGPPLAAALGAGPDLITPNREELAELAGRPLGTLGAVVGAAAQVRDRGPAAVLVSLGRDGAVLVSATGAIHAVADPVTPRSTVGAGDAALAGFLAAGGRGADALRQAVAWGTAAVRLPGTAMPGPDDIDPDAVRVDEPRDDRPLEEPVTTGANR